MHVFDEKIREDWQRPWYAKENAAHCFLYSRLHVYWVTHDSGIIPFRFDHYKLHNFLVNISFLYTIGVCNKMVFT